MAVAALKNIGDILSVHQTTVQDRFQNGMTMTQSVCGNPASVAILVFGGAGLPRGLPAERHGAEGGRFRWALRGTTAATGWHHQPGRGRGAAPEARFANTRASPYPSESRSRTADEITKLVMARLPGSSSSSTPAGAVPATDAVAAVLPQVDMVTSSQLAALEEEVGREADAVQCPSDATVVTSHRANIWHRIARGPHIFLWSSASRVAVGNSE